jgi:thiol-disulfide isomerase/thioredoxin
MDQDQTSPPSSSKRGLLAVAAAALAAGVGVQWWRHSPQTPADPSLQALWMASFEQADGTPLKLADFQGKPLVLNFWATWCTPCVEEMPLLDAFYRENKVKNWQMIGIAIDQPSSVRRFLGQNPVSYPIALGGLQGTEWGKALGNAQGGLPFTVVLNANGDVIAQYLGKLKEDQIKSWPSLAA